jgi:hypothetical protein
MRSAIAAEDSAALRYRSGLAEPALEGMGERMRACRQVCELRLELAAHRGLGAELGRARRIGQAGELALEPSREAVSFEARGRCEALRRSGLHGV